MKNSSDECQAELALPYPPIAAESNCREYAYAMLSNVGSDNSEMNAVSLYFYNSLILNPDYALWARCFHAISIVEMRHLHIYADLAWQMGLDPLLWSLKKQGLRYWSPSYNLYPRAVREVLLNALNSEQAAIQKYSQQAQQIEDESIVQILQRIILDEEHHVEIFQSMLAEL